MKRDWINKFVGLAAFLMTGILCCNGQEVKELAITKIRCTSSPSAEEIPALLDKNGIAFQPIDVINWKEYPYQPKVSFRIAHTGKEILLHYKVKEASIRAVAGKDNGRVWEDACVEFFVSPDGDSCYYNFECNCVGNLLIQGGTQNEERPLASPHILSSVERWSTLGHEPFDEKRGECSWELTMAIPVSAFFKHTLDSFDGKRMKGNFYKCGDKLQTPHFLSWNPIPLEYPMFHCPAFFGNLSFE